MRTQWCSARREVWTRILRRLPLTFAFVYLSAVRLRFPLLWCRSAYSRTNIRKFMFIFPFSSVGWSDGSRSNWATLTTITFHHLAPQRIRREPKRNISGDIKFINFLWERIRERSSGESISENQSLLLFSVPPESSSNRMKTREQTGERKDNNIPAVRANRL